MTRLLSAICLLVLGCAPVPPGNVARSASSSSDPAAATVVTATERLLLALRDRDTASLRELVDPDVRFYAVRIDNPTLQVRTFGAEEFLRLVSQSPEPLVERISNPQVHVDGPIASLWAPYDFHIGARFSHCGRAAFHFVLRDGTWRLMAETYTVRSTPCEAPRRNP